MSDEAEDRFTAAIKLIRNDAAWHVAEAYRNKTPNEAEKWISLYGAITDAYPDVCADPNLLP